MKLKKISRIYFKTLINHGHKLPEVTRVTKELKDDFAKFYSNLGTFRGDIASIDYALQHTDKHKSSELYEHILIEKAINLFYIDQLQESGFNVLSVVCDDHATNASVYKKFLSLFKSLADDLFNANNSKKIYLLFTEKNSCFQSSLSDILKMN